MKKALSEIIKKQKQCTTLGIRGTHEKYEIGEILGTSYLWDYEVDTSSYYTDNPVELGGVCATAVDSHNWVNGFVDINSDEELGELIDDILAAYEHNKEYCYPHTYLIIGVGDTSLANDPGEVIISNATVLYKF